MKADFSEKTYEVAFAGELHPYMIATHENAEKLLGYDAFGKIPLSHPIWRMLNRFPAGIKLTKSHWGTDPSRQPKTNKMYVDNGKVSNLILQYKAPEYLTTKSALQWDHWKEPYYRFEIDKAQQAVLETLARNLKRDAVVRYASACFHTKDEFDTFHDTCQIVKKSGFTAPTALVGHSYWTYIEPGRKGYANQARPGEEVWLENVSNLRESLSAVMRSPSEAVRAVFQAIEAFIGEDVDDLVSLVGVFGEFEMLQSLKLSKQIGVFQNAASRELQTRSEEFDEIIREGGIDKRIEDEDVTNLKSAYSANRALEILGLNWILAY